MGRRFDGQLVLTTCAALCAVAAGCSINPVTGQKEFMLVTGGQELALGDQAHPSILGMYGGRYRDPELHAYLSAAVMRLHALSHRPDIGMDFTMLNTSVVNAFATPGHVYATRGFLARMENEAQFAFVMGHEIGHVAARHTAGRMTRGVVTGLLIEAGQLAAGKSRGGRLAVELGGAGITLMGLSYSRQQEHQADELGVYYMARGGWDPRQALAVQRILGSLGDRQPGLLDRYLSTHPPTEERLADIERAIEDGEFRSEAYIQGDGIYAARWDGHIAGLREVHAAYEPYDRGMEALAQERYGDALAAAQEALDRRTDQAPFHRLKGDALLGLGRPLDAVPAYEAALAVDEQYVQANVGLGRACSGSTIRAAPSVSSPSPCRHGLTTRRRGTASAPPAIGRGATGTPSSRWRRWPRPPPTRRKCTTCWPSATRTRAGRPRPTTATCGR